MPKPVFDSIQAGILSGFPDIVRELGGQPDSLLLAAGFPPDGLEERRALAGYRQAAELLERAAAALGCPDFGLRLAARQRGDVMFGALGDAMRHAPTFGEALRFVSEHSYAHSLAAGIWIKRSGSGRFATVGHDILLDRLPHRAQLMEQFMLVGHLMALDLTGGQARARRVLFRHQPMSPPQVYRRYFGCEVRFGQHADGTVYSEHDLQCPLVASDAVAFAAARSLIEARFAGRRAPLHAQVRGVVTHFLGSELCTNARVADELGLHPRTMHRRLADEGTSFQRIKDEVRRDLMIYYLGHTRLSLGRVSEQLGFAEQSVMTRFSQKWFGATPTELRAHPAPDVGSDLSTVVKPGQGMSARVDEEGGAVQAPQHWRCRDDAGGNGSRSG